MVLFLNKETNKIVYLLVLIVWNQYRLWSSLESYISYNYITMRAFYFWGTDNALIIPISFCLILRVNLKYGVIIWLLLLKGRECGVIENTL